MPAVPAQQLNAFKSPDLGCWHRYSQTQQNAQVPTASFQTWLLYLLDTVRLQASEKIRLPAGRSMAHCTAGLEGLLCFMAPA